MENRRQYERIFFSAEDGITASVASADSQIFSDAMVMDMSISGIRLSLSKREAPNVNEGDRLTLIRLGGARELETITSSDMEIRWVLKLPSLSHIVLGCFFVNPQPEMKKNILTFMESWI